MSKPEDARQLPITDLSAIIPIGFEPATFARMLERWLLLENPAMIREIVNSIDAGADVHCVALSPRGPTQPPSLSYRIYGHIEPPSNPVGRGDYFPDQYFEQPRPEPWEDEPNDDYEEEPENGTF